MLPPDLSPVVLQWWHHNHVVKGFDTKKMRKQGREIAIILLPSLSLLKNNADNGLECESSGYFDTETWERNEERKKVKEKDNKRKEKEVESYVFRYVLDK